MFSYECTKLGNLSRIFHSSYIRSLSLLYRSLSGGYVLPHQDYCHLRHYHHNLLNFARQNATFATFHYHLGKRPSACAAEPLGFRLYPWHRAIVRNSQLVLIPWTFAELGRFPCGCSLNCAFSFGPVLLWLSLIGLPGSSCVFVYNIFLRAELT